MKLKMLSFLAVILFTGSSFENSSMLIQSFGYGHCYDLAESIEQDAMDGGNSAEFSYNLGTAMMEDCINDVNNAAAEYWATP